MALHRNIQWLLLIGMHIEELPAPVVPPAPAQVCALIDAVADSHRHFDERAIHFGHRYRSGFWAIYLLSAIAGLFAFLPLALAWDDPTHALHSFAGLWAIGEVAVIGTVCVIYWQGHRRDWQGQWMRARTTAELSGYLPLVAPLLDFDAETEEGNWYLRIFNPDQHLRGMEEITALCARIEPIARTRLAAAWADTNFVGTYTAWSIGVLEQQRHYHRGIAARHHALHFRIHRINTALFGLTAIGALLHRVIHSLWLSVITSFFPALGASLHGALAQSEAYRLGASSERLAAELQGAILRIRSLIEGAATAPNALKTAIQDAMGLLLDEHQDWHLLVLPHNLSLA